MGVDVDGLEDVGCDVVGPEVVGCDVVGWLVVGADAVGLCVVGAAVVGLCVGQWVGQRGASPPGARFAATWTSDATSLSPWSRPKLACAL